MKEKNRPKRNKRIKGSIAIFLVVALILIVVVNIALSHDSRMTTNIVRRGLEEDSFGAEGYVFRKQTILVAPQGGYAYSVADEEQRVKNGEAVVQICKNEINFSATSEIKAIDEKIEQLSGAAFKGDMFSNDPAKIEQEISQNLKSIPHMGYEGNLEEVRDVLNKVNSLIEKRRVAAGEAEPSNADEEIKKLKAEKARIEKEFNIERTLINAPTPGVYTSKIDGLEEKLSLDMLDDISVSYVEELEKFKTADQKSDKIKEGEAVGKIVDNFSWSIAAVISADEADGIKVGDHMGVRLAEVGTETADAVVTKLAMEDDKALLVVTSDKYLSSIYCTSKAKFEFVKEKHSGFRIPGKSLRMKDEKMGVYVIRNNKAVFVTVELLYSGKDWIVVAENTGVGENRVLKLYDELIVSGENIYDGKVVR